MIAVLGGCEIDLTEAEAEGEPVVIEIIAFMGGAGVRVPDGWNVVVEAVPVMGGIDVRTRPVNSGRKLIVRGLALMGGIEIKSVAKRTA